MTLKVPADVVMATQRIQQRSSPRIVKLEWGRLEVEGCPQPFKDGKLFPGGAREWDWRETGMNHRPGIQPMDVQELLDHGAEVVVLSRGMHECLHVAPETERWLQEHRVPYYILKTPEAVALYNRLAETTAVGALIHTTC